MTEKLYYQDSHICVFSAHVLSSVPVKGGYEICLDRTAFFPGGGGQNCDTGTLGEVRVTDVREAEGKILHTAEAPLSVGETVQGRLDWDTRFRRMQNHTGEHLFSGMAHRLYGCENVGFHMGENDVTVDLSKPLSEENLLSIEQAANEKVMENVPVTACFPDSSVLKTLSYRSKLDLTENVRIVTIENCDRCACCAPHVSHTGEVGLIKVTDFTHHRGGTRLQLVCGLNALEDYRIKQKNIGKISSLLSVKQGETGEAVTRILQILEEEKAASASLKQQLVEEKLRSLPAEPGALCLFETNMDRIMLRELVNGAVKRRGGICAAFNGQDGDYQYVIGSRDTDLRLHVDVINRAIGGRGGGSSAMISGRCTGTKQDITAFFAALSL